MATLIKWQRERERFVIADVPSLVLNLVPVHFDLFTFSQTHVATPQSAAFTGCETLLKGGHLRCGLVSSSFACLVCLVSFASFHLLVSLASFACSCCLGCWFLLLSLSLLSFLSPDDRLVGLSGSSALINCLTNGMFGGFTLPLNI